MISNKKTLPDFILEQNVISIDQTIDNDFKLLPEKRKQIISLVLIEPSKIVCPKKIIYKKNIVFTGII